MRPRKRDRHLPARVYFKHGAYWYVEKNKWQRLSTDLPAALQRYAELIDTNYRGGMSELIDKVLSHIEPNLKPNTMAQYRVAAAKLKPILVEFAPHQVMQRHVAEIKNSMAKTPNMSNRCLSFLRTVFTYAVEWQLCDSNPCIGVRRLHENKRDVYVSDDDFHKVRSAAQHRALPAIMDICYLTGQRIGDVLKIQHSDITDAGISIIQQKTGIKLTIAMNYQIQDAIALAIKRHPITTNQVFLLYSRNNKPYAYRTIYDALQRSKQIAGVEIFNLHDIRAKSLTDADQQGLDAQKLGGHANRRMTDRYIRLRRSEVVLGPKNK